MATMDVNTKYRSDSFEILPATRDDIPRLGEIHVVTCMADGAFRLYFKSAEHFTQRVVAMLESQMGNPEWYHVKTVDKEIGSVAA